MTWKESFHELIASLCHLHVRSETWVVLIQKTRRNQSWLELERLLEFVEGRLRGWWKVLGVFIECETFFACWFWWMSSRVDNWTKKSTFSLLIHNSPDINQQKLLRTSQNFPVSRYPTQPTQKLSSATKTVTFFAFFSSFVRIPFKHRSKIEEKSLARSSLQSSFIHLGLKTFSEQHEHWNQIFRFQWGLLEWFIARNHKAERDLILFRKKKRYFRSNTFENNARALWNILVFMSHKKLRRKDGNWWPRDGDDKSRVSDFVESIL